MPTLLIRGGRVLDPASGTDRPADIAIADGRIAQIDPGLHTGPADRVIDAEGCLVTPGLIDPHVHLREPGQEHKETLATGTAAAVAGGFTTVCCMPNTAPALDSPELLAFIHYHARETGHCRVFPVAAATKGRQGAQLAEISLLARAGAVGFSDDGDCVAAPDVMARVLSAVRLTGLAFMQHCQEPALTRGSVMHAGTVATRLGLGGWPRVAEEMIIERDVRLNRGGGVGCRYHVQHISSGESVEIVRRARRDGQPVTAEASPHHLLLTHDECARPDGLGYNTLAKMNPPLRERSDIDEMLRGIADGTITVLATDHAPHTAEEKALPFEEAPFGIVGLETALALYIEALIEPGVVDWMRLIDLMTVQPAALCNLDRAGLGRLSVGGPADVTVIDPAIEWTIRAEDLASKSKNTPFDGRRVKGRAVATVVGGELRHSLQFAR
jgi:dihydroorotase